VKGKAVLVALVVLAVLIGAFALGSFFWRGTETFSL